MKLFSIAIQRFDNFSDTFPNVLKFVESFSKSCAIQNWINYWESQYGLPRSVVEQSLKAYLVSRVDYKISSFDKNLKPSRFWWYLIKYCGFWLKAATKSQLQSSLTYEYEIIADQIESQIEFDRYKEFLCKFKSGAVIATLTNIKKNDSTIDVIYRPRLSGYRLSLLIKSLAKEFVIGMPKHLVLCLRAGINPIPLAANFHENILNYESLFSFVKCRHLFQERHYSSSPIKNYLFKKHGGKCVSSLQKNLIMAGHNSAYYDFDILFAFGKKTWQRADKFGAQIKNVHAVGPYFMELSMRQENSILPPAAVYDIVYIGGNYGEFQNVYHKYEDDYYSGFDWISKLNKRFPHMKIGIKHHSNYRIDVKEKNITKGSNVDYIEKTLSSYLICINAKLIVTFNSTMAYELLAHGKNVIVFDPEGRNYQFFPKGEIIDPFRVTSYEEFQKSAEEVLFENKRLSTKIESDDFCLKYEGVSERIYSILLNY